VKKAVGRVKGCHRDEDLRLHPQLTALVGFAVALQSHREVSRICGKVENCKSWQLKDEVWNNN